MDTAFTKEDLSFIAEIMDQKYSQPRLLMAVGDDPDPAINPSDKVNGDMSIPKPLEVNVNGTMSVDDYNKCAMIISVCQNMVQKTLTDAAKVAGVETSEALKNMDAWVKAYVDFPFPFFNFKDTQSDTYKKSDFSLKADPEVVEKIVNIKGVDGLKDAVIGALQKSGGELVKYEKTERHFKYFGVISAFNETEISTRVIKFDMNLKNTVTKALCVTHQSTDLDTAYDTYQFVADKNLMITMQSKMGDKMADYMADKLLEFVKTFYDAQLTNYQAELAALIKKKS